MITTHKQAVAVQQRRVAHGKHGTAKAVRRYLLRTDPYNYTTNKYKLPVILPN